LGGTELRNQERVGKNLEKRGLLRLMGEGHPYYRQKEGKLSGIKGEMSEEMVDGGWLMGR
jgi:hypothetical protein